MDTALEELNKAIAEVGEELEKAAGKKGEGSRGGKVVGHTKSGKPIYEGESHRHDSIHHQSEDPHKFNHEHMKNMEDHHHERAMEAHEFLHHKGKTEHKETHKQLHNLHGLYLRDGKKNKGFMEEAQKRHAKMDSENTNLNPNPEKQPHDPIVEGHNSKGEPIHAVKKSENKGGNMEELLKTIKALGKDGLKKALPSLSDAQKELLRDVLVKAKDMTKPEQMDANKKPQKAKEPVTEEVSNSEDGVDEADEKLMDDANKTQDHQGGGDSKPEGWTGQVIKSEAREEAKEKIMAMEEAEHGTKDPEKLVEDEKKEHGLEKSEIMHKMVERMRKRGMERVKCLDAMKKKGYDHEMADKFWTDQDEADKVKEAPSVEAVKKEPKKMEKSIQWGDPQAALRSGTLGRNFHFSAEEEVIKSFEVQEEFKKSGQRFQGAADEVLEKSGSAKKSDINDIIAKSMDRSEMQVVAQSLSLTQAKPTISSFSEEDFLKSWNPADQSKLKKLSTKPEKSDEERAKEEADKIVQKKSGEEK